MSQPGRKRESRGGDGIDRNLHCAFAEWSADPNIDAVGAVGHEPQFTGVKIGFTADRLSQFGRRSIAKGGFGGKRSEGNRKRFLALDLNQNLGASRDHSGHADGDARAPGAYHPGIENVRTADVGLNGRRTQKSQERQQEKSSLHRWTFLIQPPNKSPSQELKAASAKATATERMVSKLASGSAGFMRQKRVVQLPSRAP